MVSPTPTPSQPSDSPPAVTNPVGILFVNEGQLFSFQLPEDTFSDVEDGLTSNLLLTLLHVDGRQIEVTSWVQLAENPYTLYAFPLASEVVGGTITDYQFLLQARDSSDNNVTSVVTLRVIPRYGVQNTNFITVFIEGSFTLFLQNFTARIALSQRIANPDQSSIYFREFQNGSIAVTYTNLSIPSHDCSGFFMWVDTIYISNNYTPLYHTKLFPFLPIEEPILTGPCIKDEVVVSFSELPPTDGTINRRPLSLLIILVAVVVPIVALACLLLLLGGLVCALYRRRSKREKAGGSTYDGRFPAMLPGEVEGVPYRYRAPTILTDELPRRVNQRGYLPLLHPSITPPPPPPPPAHHPIVSSLEEMNNDEDDDDDELVDMSLVTLQGRHSKAKPPPEYRLPLLDD